MIITSVTIKNFRALEDIEATFGAGVNVIVGPNAIGKTTLLEAIRLTKALLIPRTPNEANQALMSLGATTPLNQQRLIIEALANDPTKPVLVRCRFKLTDGELQKIQLALPGIATDLALEFMGAAFADVARKMAALSSPKGTEAVKSILLDLEKTFDEIRKDIRPCTLEIRIDPIQGVTSGNPFDNAILAHLDRELPPNQTIFSYFPADRAIPSQDAPVQIGIADASSQVESHNSQPQLKYQRLKNTIFNGLISSEEGRKQLSEDFGEMFNRILKGRKLHSVGVNQHGLLTIAIQDTESGRTFGIDAMSSGEKGLILTFLLIARSVVEGGIVLLDEPELHLNPAVCKEFLPFLTEEYAKKRNLQMLICSHSPEILGGAFERDDCALYHLVSGKLLTPVRRQDQEEVYEALKRLGTSASDDLLYKATVFVEGEHDSEILDAGFEVLFRRYKLKDLGGRRAIEREIQELQNADTKGAEIAPKFFIFDRDGAPTGLKNSPRVRFLQWPRRCLENHLIDINILTNILKEPHVATKPVRSVGELQNILKELAMSQLDAAVAKLVYSNYAYENSGLRPAEVNGRSFPQIASVLFARLAEIKKQLDDAEEARWTQSFVAACEGQKVEMAEVWEAKWQEECDGKRLFADLQKRLEIAMPLLRFKKAVIREMKHEATEGWRAMESLLKELLTGTTV